MKTFLMSMVGFAILTYALLLVCSAVMGDAGAFIAAILVIGALGAMLACVLEKLAAVEDKLDRLLREKERDAAEK